MEQECSFSVLSVIIVSDEARMLTVGRGELVMTTEELLKNRILQNYKSVRAFALELGVPYTTVDTMLKKGVRFSGLELVSRVCRGLGLELGALEKGILRESADPPEGLISKAEREHIRRYRALDRHGKRAVDLLLALETERLEENGAPREELPVAARSNSGETARLTLRRNFSSEELEGEETEF